MDTLGKRVYLLGSDYLFPRTANLIIRDLVKANHGTVLAERYRPLGDSDFSAVIAEIRALKPDVVLNTINGDSNTHFFRALHEAGLGAVPVVSFSVAEDGLKAIGPEAFHPNHYAVWGYFQSLPGEANLALRRRVSETIRNRPGNQRPDRSRVCRRAAVGPGRERCGHRRPERGQPRHAARRALAAPSGIAAVDRSTRHLWKQVHIGKARADGQFDLVWSSGSCVRPAPFPDYRSRVRVVVAGIQTVRCDDHEGTPHFHPLVIELSAGGGAAAGRAGGVLSSSFETSLRETVLVAHEHHRG